MFADYIDFEEDNYSLAFDDIITQTDKAYLVLFGTEQVWIPKSISTIEATDNSIIVPDWFIFKNELECFINE